MPQADIFINYFSHVIKEEVGLSIISTKGVRWSVVKRCSREKDNGILTRNEEGVPCWESWKIISEYIAPKTVDKPTKGNNHNDHFISEVSIMISPIRLGEGGSPKLAAHISNHHRVLSGNKSFNPRVIARVRVLFRSYTVFARENREEDTNPCAIISIIAPLKPHQV